LWLEVRDPCHPNLQPQAFVDRSAQPAYERESARGEDTRDHDGERRYDDRESIPSM